MKVFRKQMFYYLTLAGLGLAVLAVGFWQGQTAGASGLAGGLIGVSAVKVVQLWRLSRDPERVRKYEIMQKEERLIMIVQQSGYRALQLILVLELLAALVLIVSGRESLGLSFAYLAAIQTMIYLLMYWRISRRS